jgi:hypothetical protein
MNGDPIYCAACGDVVGVYEPALVIERDTARQTSLAKERPSEAGGVRIAHLACTSGLGGFAAKGTTPTALAA